MTITLSDLPFEDGYLDQFHGRGRQSGDGRWHLVTCTAGASTPRPTGSMPQVGLRQLTCDRCIDELLHRVPASQPGSTHWLARYAWMTVREENTPLPQQGDNAYQRLVELHEPILGLARLRYGNLPPTDLGVVETLDDLVVKRFDALVEVLRSPGALADLAARCEAQLRDRSCIADTSRFLFGYPEFWISAFADEPRDELDELSERIVFTRTIHHDDHGHRVVEVDAIEAYVLLITESPVERRQQHCRLDDGSDPSVIATAAALWEPNSFGTPLSQLRECVAVAQAVLA